MKQILIWITTSIILLSCIITVSAVGKVSTSLELHVLTLDSLPAETAYIDVLLPFGEISDCFTELTTPDIDYTQLGEKIQIPVESQIVNYDTDGFYSYSSHFKNAKITIKKGESNNLWIRFGTYDRDDLYYFQKCSSIKLAYIDKYGNIIKTTDQLSVHNRLFFTFQSLELNGKEVKCVYSLNPYHCVPALILLTLLCSAVIVKLDNIKKSRAVRGQSEGNQGTVL